MGAPGEPSPQPIPGQPYAQPYPVQPVQPGYVDPNYPQGGYVVQQQTTTYTTSPPPPPVMHTGAIFWGEVPQNHVCQFCNANVVTRVNYDSGLLTWLACGGLCLVGCWLGCCFIPFCVDGCKDVVHTCPNCNKLVGKKNRI
eukprot:TRINITY_DN3331_c0_g1_i1.p1 TRINITY_DN3331_c0_g1~~TRINITY_DN3331_c0_g1_i1.p1  ORF type:complete len:141 (-),score=30.51 TRINITY_DN3331_c0_g1_i1:102-524(-)